MMRMKIRGMALRILACIVITAAISLYFYPLVKNYGGVMLGSTGLDNTVKALTAEILARIIVVILLLCVFGIPVVRIIRRRKGGGMMAAVNIGMLIFLGILSFKLMGSQYRVYGELTNTPAVISDVGLLFGCISDRSADEYTEYTADEVLFSRKQYITRSDEKEHYRSEYMLSAYYDGELLFETPIGSLDLIDMKKHITPTKEVYFTVYEKSGLIRSYTPEADLEIVGYTYMFTITFDGEKIIRSESESEEMPDDLTWYGFRKGQGGDLENALFGINAENDTELDCADICDEVCLYAWIGGEYKPVSNTVRFYEE